MKPPRVVLDTNILISAIVFGGPPREILQLVLGGSVFGVISIPILDELRDVLLRPKFGFSSEQVLAIVEELHAAFEVNNPPQTITAIKNDPDDNRVLECASAGNATHIVNGDSDLLDLGSFKRIKILTAADFHKLAAQQREQRR